MDLTSSHRPCLSVLIPVYNERDTLHQIVEKVLNRPEVAELVVVDDCSSDEAWGWLRELVKKEERVRIFRHDRNRGKGAAIRTGMKHITSDYVLIQDADLEYDPDDYPRLLQHVFESDADVVYGSRFTGSNPHRVLYFWHYMGNRVLTIFSNLLTGITLTDMETCYKLFKAEVIRNVRIEEDRFGFEPEITAKVVRMGATISEVPISYRARRYKEGKKIGWKDGFRAIWCILKYNLRRSPP